MDPDEEVEGPPPRFLGDDPRPTSKKELAGWYCYGWAAEVFTVCAMGTSPPFDRSLSSPFAFRASLSLTRPIQGRSSRSHWNN